MNKMAGKMAMGPDGANVFTDRVHEADWPTQARTDRGCDAAAWPRPAKTCYAWSSPAT